MKNNDKKSLTTPIKGIILATNHVSRVNLIRSQTNDEGGTSTLSWEQRTTVNMKMRVTSAKI